MFEVRTDVLLIMFKIVLLLLYPCTYIHQGGGTVARKSEGT